MNETVEAFAYTSCKDYKCYCNYRSVEGTISLCSINVADKYKKGREEMCNRLIESQNKVDIRFSEKDEGILVFKNMENKKLTDVVITINDYYTTHKGVLESKEEYSVDKATIVSNKGRKMSKSTNIGSVYLYSNEGKWIWGIDWRYLGDIRF